MPSHLRFLPSTNKTPDENQAFLLQPHTASALPPSLAYGESDAVPDSFLFPPFKGLNRLVGRDFLLQLTRRQVKLASCDH